MMKVKRKARAINYKDLTITCVGKLPFANDYIKYQLDHPRLLKLYNWIHQAYQGLQLESKKRGTLVTIEQLPTCYFIEVDDNDKIPLIACIKQSKDTIGRDYPCTMMHPIAKDVARQYVSIIPLMYRDFFISASTIDKGIAQTFQAYCLDSLISKLYGTLPIEQGRNYLMDTIMQLNRLSLCDLTQHYMSRFHELSFIDFLYNHISMLRSLNNGQGSIHSQYFKIPLPSQDDNFYYVTFWLLLFETLCSEKNDRYYAIWHDGGRKQLSMMYVYFGTVPFQFAADILLGDGDEYSNDNYFKLVDSETPEPDLSMSLFDFVCQMR